MLLKHDRLLHLKRRTNILCPLNQFNAAAAASGSRVGGGLALYLQRAKLIDSLRLRLHSHDPSSPFTLPSSPLLDTFVAARAIRAAPSPDSALSLFRSFLSLSSFSSPPHPSLLHSLSRRFPDDISLLPDLRLSPLHRLRLLAAAGDRPSALEVFSTIRSSPDSLRHRHRHPCTESYNLIIGLHASAGDHSSAVSIFSQMLSDGAIPNSRTYTVIIDHLVQANKIDAAMEVFHLLPSMRIRRTSKQYNVLANAFSSSGQFEHLLRLIEEMKSDGILPGRPMLAAIAKLRSAGFIDKTEVFVRELSPDQRVGYAIDSTEEEDNDSEKEEEGDYERIKLKPWIDPVALARALEDWNPTDVALLEAAGFIWSSRLVCKMLRSFRTAKTAWEFFCWLAYEPNNFAHDSHTVSRMIAILAREGHVELINCLLSKIQSEGIMLPFDTIRLIVDFYGLSKNADAAIKIYRSARSICGPLSRLKLMLLSSSLLRTVIKCRKGHDAMSLFEMMMAEGILLDIQTFSGLMEYFAREDDLKSVHRLFGTARQCGLKPDSLMFEVLIRTYCKQERAVLALRVFDEMLSSGLVPSGGTKGILVKCLWKEGKLREAATVHERSEEIANLPVAQLGHLWTVSAADLRRVLDVYSGNFAEGGREGTGAEGV